MNTNIPKHEHEITLEQFKLYFFGLTIEKMLEVINNIISREYSESIRRESGDGFSFILTDCDGYEQALDCEDFLDECRVHLDDIYSDERLWVHVFNDVYGLNLKDDFTPYKNG